MLALWKKSSGQTRQHIKKQRHYFADKGWSSQNYGFSNSHVWMWELDHKESWVLKNWYVWTVVLEKALESPLDCKEIKPVHPKGNQSWIFIGRNDAEAPILWPPDVKTWLIRNDPDAGKDWRQEDKGISEDYEMVGWHHWLNEHKVEQAPGDGEGQGSLACCSPWGGKELDRTERLNNHNKYVRHLVPTLGLSVPQTIEAGIGITFIGQMRKQTQRIPFDGFPAFCSTNLYSYVAVTRIQKALKVKVRP